MGKNRDCKRFQNGPAAALVSAFLAFACLAVGCGGEVRLDHLDVRRIGWDTLRVAPAFARTALFASAVAPDSLTVTVSDTRGRTLYAGYAARPRRPLIVPVPDKLLGNAAPFMLDLCGHFGGEVVCEQEMLNASPKRFSARLDVDYPLGRDRDRLAWRVAWRQERQRSGGAWERVPVPPHLPARLVLYVEGFPTDAAKIAFTGGAGEASLAAAPGYDDFWMRLNDPLLRGDSARVVVQLEALDGPRPEAAATLYRWVRPPSPEERQQEAYAFADAALAGILDALETARDGRAELSVEGWRFDPLQRVYHVRLALGWSGGFLHMGRYRLAGLLSVEETSRRALFNAQYLSPDIQKLWYSRVGGETLNLGALPSLCAEGCAEEFGQH